MDNGMKPFLPLFRKVAAQSDEHADAQRTAKQASQRALARWEERQKAARPAFRMIAAFAAALVIGLAVFVVASRPSPDALSFVIGEASEPGKVGAWILSPPGGLPLRFSEGTVIVLEPGASGRVTSAYPIEILPPISGSHPPPDILLDPTPQ